MVFDIVSSEQVERNIVYSQNIMRAGVLCFIAYRDAQRALLVSVTNPCCYCSARHSDYETVNAMEFLAEVHAGSVPEYLLTEPEALRPDEVHRCE